MKIINLLLPAQEYICVQAFLVRTKAALKKAFRTRLRDDEGFHHLNPSL